MPTGMNGALTGVLTGTGESLCHRFAGIDIEDPDEVTLVILVHDANGLADSHLQLGGEDLDILSRTNSVTRAPLDDVLIVGGAPTSVGCDQSSRLIVGTAGDGDR